MARERNVRIDIHRIARCLISSAGLLLAAVSLSVSAAQIDIPGPVGSGAFGTTVTVLPNGNFVVTDPNGPVSNVGAVYLYSPTGVLISNLTGSSADDHVGDGGVTVLSNGNFVVRSLLWNGAAADVGAVTWINGTTGLSGVVSQANSLIGTRIGDAVGSKGVTALSNGHYVVVSPNWDDNFIQDVGAVTWANGSTGRSGPVSPGNSLIGGTRPGSVIGSGGVIELSNGNYVIVSPDWDDEFTGTGSVGAVTWANGSMALSGGVLIDNSLIGTTSLDQVGSKGVTALSNGNYVVASPLWNNTTTADVGAVTWANGSTGRSGRVLAANSLVGTTTSDQVGDGGVTALSNGNYVVVSQFWDNSTTTNVGAATWANGSTAVGGRSGAVLASNSLIGTSTDDFIGSDGVTALSNGNYVVASQSWSSGTANVGAATWGPGGTGLVGVVSGANSLIGTTAGNRVGIDGVTALSNGNYVVVSPLWDNGTPADVGAVTWGNGSMMFAGVVSPSNSLVGTTASDQVGSAGVTALTNGNYVVNSPGWDNGATASANVGAATWANGSTGLSSTGLAGAILPANSLIGTRAGDQIGSAGVVALTNGMYTVCSPLWSISLGQGFTGAVTWANGSVGLAGAVSQANSWVGMPGDTAGDAGVTALSDGNYVISSDGLASGIPNTRREGVTLARGDTGLVGTIGPTNSVTGTAPIGSPTPVFDYDVAREQLVVGRPGGNIVSLFTLPGDFVFANGFE